MIDSKTVQTFTLHNQGGAVIPVLAMRPSPWRRANAWR
jgi:alpha-D-ribose 1-methylphosphonate 5-triphosphate synthase subunit PhnL